MTDTQTVIFYGRSGSGKGTQAVLLKKFLEEHDEAHETLYYETGKALRALAEEDSVAGRLTKDVLDTGRLMPSLLVVWQWGDYFMREVKPDRHLLLDGVARRPEEAPLVEGALEFFERKNPKVILMDVPRQWSFDRLMERAREDDTEENINKRLDWYEDNALKAVEYFEEHDSFEVIKINGNQSIEEVHANILEALNLSHHKDAASS